MLSWDVAFDSGEIVCLLTTGLLITAVSHHEDPFG